MDQTLKNFIPLGDTGSVCYLRDTLKDFDSNNILNELKAKKIQKLILLRSLTKKINYDSITPLLQSNGFKFSFYTPNSEFKKQVELFESILDSDRQGNLCILFCGTSPALIELTIKLVLYVNLRTPIEEIYSYLTNENPDIITLTEFKKYIDFLENDPYLITKPDRIEFNRKKLKTTIQTNGAKSELSIQDSRSNTSFTLNLSSLKTTIPDNEPLLTETEAIQFNLNSLVESNFEKEESPEEHYQKMKGSVRREVDNSLSLDVDLSEEIEYISSLESLSGPTMDKISVINIDTVPLDSPTHKPTIDYKSKNYLDFDAIIDEEIEQGMLTEELSGGYKSGNEIPFPEALNIDDIIQDEKEDVFSFGDDLAHEDSRIDLDAIDTKANIDLSFPPPLQDLEDLLEEDLELEHGKYGSLEDPVDPSQTFMVKRINDVIKKEVLNEDSKGKIPVSDLTKIDTKDTEVIKKNTNPTTPKISNPKISNPKFNPITLED